MIDAEESVNTWHGHWTESTAGGHVARGDTSGARASRITRYPLTIDHATRGISGECGEGKVVRFSCQGIVENEQSGGEQNFKGVTVGIVVFKRDED
jgi:hypothetical protein